MKIKRIRTCADCEHYEMYHYMLDDDTDGAYCYKAHIQGSIKHIPKGCPLEDAPDSIATE